MKNCHDFPILLAKSLSQEEAKCDRAKGAAKYTGHISCVMQAAEILTEELGAVILRQLGLKSFDLTYFANTVKLGAYLHDWGKANLHFQLMVYHNSLNPESKERAVVSLKAYLKNLKNKYPHPGGQMLRHEVISGILALRVPSFREWLEQCPDANLMIAVWAAMGHHLKIGVGQNGKPANCIAEVRDGSELKIYTGHPDFQAMLRMGKQIKLPEKLPDCPPEIWQRSELEKALKALRKEFDEFKFQISGEQQKFAAAVKATVIAADLAGSALPLAIENSKEWIREVLNLKLLPDELKQLVTQRLQGKQTDDCRQQFQQRIANSKYRVTLAIAGCGTGKTIAAYEWAQTWAVGGKLFFCYPTTGTASQGYIDYADGTEIEATLMHSRADLDRELLFSGETDDSEGIDARLAAFGAWRKKLIICTVDSVLGLIQNNRKPLYSWPAIAQSAFVFDEVHAYDSRLFGALLQFLKAFRGAPILLMSASFTPGQLEAIRQVMAELGEEFGEPIKGPPELEELERYQIQFLAEVADLNELPELWLPVIEALKNRQKVLWVTNSVQSCIDLYRLAQAKLAQDLPESNMAPLIYHSRFRYKDRLEKHKAVIEAFKAEQPVLAITTQVCEMSLDISADLLVSAMAPAAALIQRLGRLNRRMTKPEDGAKLAIIYPWLSIDKPYKKEELETGKQLIEQLTEKTAISQRHLAEISSQLNCSIPESVSSIWLEGNWATYPDFLRKGASTITVLLKQDLNSIRQAAEQHQERSFMREAQGWSLPIPIHKDLSKWKRCRFYPIAPDDRIFYSEETGAEPCK
jgi:CRISPR-associated endonuclease/helicase Cas3